MSEVGVEQFQFRLRAPARRDFAAHRDQRFFDLPPVRHVNKGEDDAVDLVIDRAIGTQANIVPAAVAAADFVPEGVTRASDPLLLYFTSGTTALPKLVAHTQVSYPVGHLSTMYWVGIQPGDVHLNLSSPGWAKHAWSNVFAPWNASATVLVLNYARFSAATLLAAFGECGVSTFCAPPKG